MYIFTGRQTCSIPIPDPTLFQAQPCPKDLVVYLEAKYDCIKVTYADHAQCKDKPIPVMTSSGYISSQVTQSLDVGSSRCPWHLEALPGQRFRISLLDFSSLSTRGSSKSESCHHYGYILEKTADVSLRVCGNRGARETHLYTTKTNSVDIVIAKESMENLSYSYIIQYQGIFNLSIICNFLNVEQRQIATERSIEHKMLK